MASSSTVSKIYVRGYVSKIGVRYNGTNLTDTATQKSKTIYSAQEYAGEYASGTTASGTTSVTFNNSTYKPNSSNAFGSSVTGSQSQSTTITWEYYNEDQTTLISDQNQTATRKYSYVYNFNSSSVWYNGSTSNPSISVVWKQVIPSTGFLADYEVDVSAGTAASILYASASSRSTGNYSAYSNTLRTSSIAPTKTGYTFNKWYCFSGGYSGNYYASGATWSTSAGAQTGTTTHKLAATYTANTYTIRFNGNNSTSGSMSDLSMTYDVAKNLTTNAFSRTGYTFKGWSTSSTATSATYTNGQSVNNLSSTNGAVVNLYAVWQANTYTVTLNNQSATTAGTTSVTATYNAAMPSATMPTKTGYTFGGYYTATGGSGTQYYTASGASAKNWNLTSNTTLYAKWTINSYTLTANANGGSISSTTGWTGTGTTATKSLNYAAQYSTLPTASKTGYTLKGWYTAASGGSQVSTTTTMGASNTTIYAQWTPITYNISYTLNSGTAGTNSPTTGTYDSVVTISNPTRTGYTFAGWTYAGGNTSTAMYGTSSSAVTTAWSNVNTKVTAQYFKNLTTTNGGTVTLYAQWTAKTFTVTLNNNGGSGGTTSVTATYASAMPTATMPTRTGYTFNGYYDTDAIIGGTQYYTAAGASARAWDRTANTTLYARWTPITYTIEFNGNNSTSGSMSDLLPMTYGEAKDLPVNEFTKTGYVFRGWATSASGVVEYKDKESVKNLTSTNGATITLYAVWALTSKVNIGGTWKTITGAKVNIGGTWKTVTNIQVNINGVWKSFNGFGN